MSTLKKAPGLVFTGFNDASILDRPVPVNQLPSIFLPLIYTFAPRGTEHAKYVAGRLMVDTFGNVTDYSSPYATHVTPLIKSLNEIPQIMLMKRLKPADAATATLRLSLDVIQKQLPVYERNLDGSYKIDGNGNRIDTGTTVAGVQAKWVLAPYTGAIGSGVITPGSMTDGATQSEIYPLMDIPAEAFGADYNNVGIRLFSATAKSTIPVNRNTVESVGSALVRMSVVQRPNARTSATITRTKKDALYSEFSLKPAAYDTATKRSMVAKTVVKDDFTTVAGNSPIGDIHTYNAHIETVLGMIHTAEVAANPNTDALASKWLINLFSATDFGGVPYTAYTIDNLAMGAKQVGELHTEYLSGGSDGTMGDAAYDALVKQEIDTFGYGVNKFLDFGRWPMSVFIDTGFSMATKDSIPKLLQRADMHVALSVFSGQELTDVECSAIAGQLRAMLRLYPESVHHNTATVRGWIMDQYGDDASIDAVWPRKIPTTVDLACLLSAYMGTTNRRLNPRAAVDEDGVRIITRLKNLNRTWKPEAVANADFSAGVVSAVSYDHERCFYPYLTNVYDKGTSVLDSLIVSFICAHMWRVSFEIWRSLVGNGRLTDAEFVQRSNNKLLEYVSGNRFDNRCVIVPETIVDGSENYKMVVNVYANKAKTNGEITVVTHNRNALLG